MKIQNISFTNTPKLYRTSLTSSQKSNVSIGSEIDILNTLTFLSINAKAQISFSGSKLDLNQLKSIKPKDRIKKLKKESDKQIPTSFPKCNKNLSPMEENALYVWKYGIFSDNNLQKDFDAGAKKRNLQEWVYIKTLDDLIEKSKPLDEECIVYRGLFGNMEYQADFINSIEEGMIIPHQSYIATATKFTDYTKLYFENEAVAVMRIKLPVGTKGILINDEADEFVLPRGGEIKINSIDKKYGVIEAEYLLPQQKPKVPEFVEEYYNKHYTEQLNQL